MDDLDSVPIMEELIIAIDHLTNVKAPWSEIVPPDLLKTSKPALLLSFHEVICQCWQEGEVPQYMRIRTKENELNEIATEIFSS